MPQAKFFVLLKIEKDFHDVRKLPAIINYKYRIAGNFCGVKKFVQLKKLRWFDFITCTRCITCFPVIKPRLRLEVSLHMPTKITRYTVVVYYCVQPAPPMHSSSQADALQIILITCINI